MIRGFGSFRNVFLEKSLCACKNRQRTVTDILLTSSKTLFERKHQILLEDHFRCNILMRTMAEIKIVLIAKWREKTELVEKEKQVGQLSFKHARRQGRFRLSYGRQLAKGICNLTNDYLSQNKTPKWWKIKHVKFTKVFQPFIHTFTPIHPMHGDLLEEKFFKIFRLITRFKWLWNIYVGWSISCKIMIIYMGHGPCESSTNARTAHWLAPVYTRLPLKLQPINRDGLLLAPHTNTTAVYSV